jgi:hypothetical protein
LLEKLGEDTFTPSPHDPQVWLKTAISDGSDMNWVYGLPMASTWELKEGHTVLTLGTLHVNPNYFFFYKNLMRLYIKRFRSKWLLS